MPSKPRALSGAAVGSITTRCILSIAPSCWTRAVIHQSRMLQDDLPASEPRRAQQHLHGPAALRVRFAERIAFGPRPECRLVLPDGMRSVELRAILDRASEQMERLEPRHLGQVGLTRPPRLLECIGLVRVDPKLVDRDVHAKGLTRGAVRSSRARREDPAAPAVDRPEPA